MKKKFLIASVLAVSVFGGMHSVSAAEITEVQLEHENELMEKVIRRTLKVKEKSTISCSDFRVISGNTKYINNKGKEVWFTAKGTYVIQCDHFFGDNEYVFTVK